MKRIAIFTLFAMLSAGAARADVDHDDVDDHPLASDLRAAFGRSLSVCQGNECSFELSAVECTTRGTATTCRAGQHKASGANAERLADHLREIAGGNDRKASTITLAKIACRSYKLDSQDQLRGHCWVERSPGDTELDGVLTDLKSDNGAPLLERSKLGEFSWTGAVHVTCKSDNCTLTCPANAEAAQWLDGCHLDPAQVVTVSNAVLARQLHARTGSATGTISCSASGGSIDGGVTSMIACDVRPDHH